MYCGKPKFSHESGTSIVYFKEDSWRLHVLRQAQVQPREWHLHCVFQGGFLEVACTAASPSSATRVAPPLCISRRIPGGCMYCGKPKFSHESGTSIVYFKEDSW